MMMSPTLWNDPNLSRGTDGLQTRRWRREMDSNFWYRGTKAMDFRSIPGIARASAGSAWPIVRQPAIS
jgi:hypothetical protein